MKKFLCLFSVALLAFTSCSKDDNDSSTPAPSILVKLIAEFEGDKPVSRDVLYNGNKVASITSADGSQKKFTYTGDFITKMEIINNNGALQGTVEYQYTNGKMVSYVRKEAGATYNYKTEYVHNTDGTVSYEEFRINVSTGVEQEYGEIGKLTYKDGNLIKKESSFYGSDSVYTYEYDDKNSPSKNMTGNSLLIDALTDVSVNNVIKETQTSKSGGNVYTYITTYTYSYDADNYPTLKVATFPNGNSTSIKTTFFAY
jgi:hypothetical protein